ncbi:DUF2232 domain-containing protein [Zavarzinia sp. CC-PAN008]|uniref:DUF2232 domain-containing protein n=1 Tax=Zavarzinia sp. CC-PAN008 TaxID=3243332 RepID=UPI003F749AB1
MPRQMLMAVIAGLAAGALALVGGRPDTAASVPILGLLASLPLFLASLSGGVQASLVAGGVATLLSAVLTQSLAGALYFAVVYALAPVVITRQALLFRSVATGAPDDGGPEAVGPDQGQAEAVEWYPPGRLLALATALAVGGFVLIWSLTGGELRDLVAGGLDALLAEIRTQVADPRSAAAFEAAAGVLRTLLPGMVGALWLGLLIGNGLLAQAILRASGRALRPTPRAAELHLPRLVPLAFGVALAFGLMGGEGGFIGSNLAVILAIPLMVQGFAVVHRASRAWPARPWVLGAVYALAFVLSWPLLMMVVLGTADCLLRTGPRPAYSGPGKKD